MKQPFPLASGIPIPADTARAAKLVAQSDPHVMAELWDSQHDALAALDHAAESHQARWNDHIDPVIKPAAAKVETVSLIRLARFGGFGASKWMDQFAVGFPIAGDLSQKNAFPLKEDNAPILPRSRISASSGARFRERAPNSGWGNAAGLWADSMFQHEKGRLSPPYPIGESGRPTDLHSDGFNIAFRLGGEQSDNLRACDDLNHSLANAACRVRTPIELVPRGNVSQLCRSYATDGREWALFNADHEAAYKQLPLDPADQPYAIIALRNPVAGRWHGFRSMTLMFGSVAAVLQYDVLSRLITAIFNRLLAPRSFVSSTMARL